eukprot:Pgem_evm1s4342
MNCDTCASQLSTDYVEYAHGKNKLYKCFPCQEKSTCAVCTIPLENKYYVHNNLFHCEIHAATHNLSEAVKMKPLV